MGEENSVWMMPPIAQRFALLPIQRVVARSERAVVVAAAVHVYREGCVIDCRAAARRRPGSPDERSELRAIFDPADRETSIVFRVEYPDGSSSSTADTAALRLAATEAPGMPPPQPPTVVALAAPGVGDADAVEVHQPLWLTPLPPREGFSITVEWPAYGIRQSVLHLDGAEIVAAAGAVRGYWEDDLD